MHSTPAALVLLLVAAATAPRGARGQTSYYLTFSAEVMCPGPAVIFWNDTAVIEGLDYSGQFWTSPPTCFPLGAPPATTAVALSCPAPSGAVDFACHETDRTCAGTPASSCSGLAKTTPVLDAMEAYLECRPTHGNALVMLEVSNMSTNANDDTRHHLFGMIAGTCVDPRNLYKETADFSSMRVTAGANGLVTLTLYAAAGCQGAALTDSKWPAMLVNNTVNFEGDRNRCRKLECEAAAANLAAGGSFACGGGGGGVSGGGTTAGPTDDDDRTKRTATVDDSSAHGVNIATAASCAIAAAVAALAAA